MSRLNVGKLARVPLREVWAHEAYDFTQWLQDNLDVLNEVLELELSNAERERAAGNFSVDLVADDDSGGTVIIENQLEKSNHDHLGKLVTYLVAMGAKAAIWIVSDPRPEHVSAVNWLNESGSADFYIIKVEAVRIGDSPAAPLLTKIVGPTLETKEIGKTKEEIAERHILRQQWWTSLFERSSTVSKLHAHITPSKHGWIAASAGIRGLSFNYVAFKHESAVELYIDRGKESDDENKRIFDQLAANREAIENQFGGALSWERLDEKRACRIRSIVPGGGYRSSEDGWPQIQDRTIAAMKKLEQALRPYLKQIKYD